MADGISDGQLATIASLVGAGLAALGVAIRWSAGLIRDAFKDTRDAQAATRAEMTQVIRDNTAAFAKFTEWLGRVDVRTEETTRRVVEVHQEISGVHEAPSAEAIAASSSDQDDDEDSGDEATPTDLPPRRHPRARSPAPGRLRGHDDSIGQKSAGYSFVKSDKKP